MKKITAAVLVCLLLSGCASCDRTMKTWKSNMAGGMNRTVRIYTQTGQKIAEHTGFMDVTFDESGRLLFDLNGQRFIYQNAIVEIIENTDDANTAEQDEAS